MERILISSQYGINISYALESDTNNDINIILTIDDGIIKYSISRLINEYKLRYLINMENNLFNNVITPMIRELIEAYTSKKINDGDKKTLIKLIKEQIKND